MRADGAAVRGPAAVMGSSLAVDLATAEDEPELRRLLRETPMSGQIHLTLEREPDSSLAAAVEGERHSTVVARAGGRLVGMGSRAVRRCWLGGRPMLLGYLSQLRLEAAYQGRGALVRRGYERLRELRQPDETPFDFTTVLADNRRALRLLEAGVPGLPTYRRLGSLASLVLRVPRGRRWRRWSGRCEVARGDGGCLGEIVACLARWGQRHPLSPCWSEEDLLSPERTRGLAPEDFFLARAGGEVTGCLALWDQRSFKQAVVRGYGASLGRWRPVINALGGWFGAPRLPAVGQALAQGFLSHLAVDGDDREVLFTLLRRALEEARARGLELVVLGLSRRHPVYPEVCRRFAPREIESLLYRVDWEGDGGGLGEIGEAVPHLEVAVL